MGSLPSYAERMKEPGIINVCVCLRWSVLHLTPCLNEMVLVNCIFKWCVSERFVCASGSFCDGCTCIGDSSNNTDGRSSRSSISVTLMYKVSKTVHTVQH